jgi:hypothetical protein
MTVFQRLSGLPLSWRENLRLRLMGGIFWNVRGEGAVNVLPDDFAWYDSRLGRNAQRCQAGYLAQSLRVSSGKEFLI